jgi:hypothetical protein
MFAASVPTFPTSFVAQAPSREAIVTVNAVILRIVARIQGSLADVGLRPIFSEAPTVPAGEPRLPGGGRSTDPGFAQQVVDEPDDPPDRGA